MFVIGGGTCIHLTLITSPPPLPSPPPPIFFPDQTMTVRVMSYIACLQEITLIYETYK